MFRRAAAVVMTLATAACADANAGSDLAELDDILDAPRAEQEAALPEEGSWTGEGITADGWVGCTNKNDLDRFVLAVEGEVESLTSLEFTRLAAAHRLSCTPLPEGAEYIVLDSRNLPHAARVLTRNALGVENDWWVPGSLVDLMSGDVPPRLLVVDR